MSRSDKSSIEQQKSDISGGLNTVKLVGSCVIGKGILRLTEHEKEHFSRRYEDWKGDASFFIPASGSGSRMFSDITQFVETGEETDAIRSFFKELPELALFQELPLVVREKFDSLQLVYLAEYLISKDGMQFAEIPKGLIPFHITDTGVVNPFQEQLKQARELLGVNGNVHYTIQKGFEEQVLESLRELELFNLDETVSFSHQDPKSDAFCFDSNGELVKVNDVPLRRPAGHGALLKNLNAIDSDLILIKNIDNVQHPNKADLNQRVWKYCAGMLLEFKSDMKLLLNKFSKEGLAELNDKYQFLSEQEEADCDLEQLKKLAKRPSRVCGMVVNEGAPGGGPFWIEDNGTISKQIVEKVQIAQEDSELVEESSHFNPVFIALSKTDIHGNPLDLEAFVDDSKFLLVNKPYNGGTIRYRELPGLWNGSMHYWNTVFVEIPKEVFSPVKSVFDLTKEAHKP
ncbi:MAG: DUF4301 family protein [bacterium]|nr:DUF4301 family protein [bacterium]